MAATITVTLRTDQANKEGKHQVRIRIQKHKQTRYYSTGIFLKYDKDKRKSEWNEAGTYDKTNWITSRNRDFARLNERIKELLSRFWDMDSQHPTYTAQQLRDSYSSSETTKTTGFLAFAQEWIRRKHANGQHGTALVYETTLSYFKGFWGTKPDTPELFTPGMVANLITYFRTTEISKTKKGYDASTINLAMRNYRTFFRNGILEGWLPQMPNPFVMPPLMEEDKHLVRPTAEQLLSLRYVEGLTPLQVHARNVNLMQYFLNGARASEVLLLRWADVSEDRIDYRPRKRSKRKKSIKRHAGIDWVLSQYTKKGKYVFPYMKEAIEKKGDEAWQKEINQRISSINQSLALICIKAKLPIRLTTHMARRAFADSVLARTDDMRKVQAAVGWDSITSANRYVEKLRQQPIDELSESIYSDLGKH